MIAAFFYPTWIPSPMRTAALLSSLLFAAGCATVTGQKTLVVEPAKDQKVVIVQADAKTVCRDFFFVFVCKMDLSLQEVSSRATYTAPTW